MRGNGANDAIALRLAAGNTAVVQVDLGDNGSADFSFPRAAIDSISVKARSGNDRVRIDDTNGAFTNTIPTRIDGGPGNDTIAGGAGAGTLNGGTGNDTIDGNAGNDVSDLGAGDDSFVWDPGDGSDTIEGNDGTDTMVFNGAAASETVDLSANGEPPAVLPQPGEHHDGHPRRRKGRFQRARRRRHGHGQRPDRHRRQERQPRPRRHPRRHSRATARPTTSSSTAPTRAMR